MDDAKPLVSMKEIKGFFLPLSSQLSVKFETLHILSFFIENMIRF
jgi:hypothetical protein